MLLFSGKGGSKISDLQYESGAKINVTKEIVGDNTIVRISGNEDEIRKAKQMIQDLTVDRTPRPKVVTMTASEWEEKKEPLPLIDWAALAEESVSFY